MSNKLNNKLDNKPNKINELVDNFIKKILILEKDSSTLETKVNQIDELLDSLIDYCIKKKIYFYIEKKIGYKQIIQTFKLYLCKFLQKLIDPTNNIISKYIDKLESENFDNYSDINSLLFRKFKSGLVSESKSKSEYKSESLNKNVSFREDISIIGYDDSEGFDFNYVSNNKSRKKLQSDSSSTSNNSSNSDSSSNSNNSSNSQNSDCLDKDKLSLYIKILLSQNKNVNEFTEKIRYMCNIISEKGIDCNKSNPFD